jgi:hypothetical protein
MTKAQQHRRVLVAVARVEIRVLRGKTASLIRAVAVAVVVRTPQAVMEAQE